MDACIRRPIRTGSRHQPELTRQSILNAAINEFAAEGIAGARIARIARTAGVNKALLYYYFQDKQTLYGAALDRVFSGLKQALETQLDRDLPAGEKILACAGAHFDYLAGSPFLPRLILSELMCSERDGESHIPRLVEQYFRPVFGRLAEVIRQGIAAGEFRPVDPMQFLPSMVAVIVFYFNSSPVLRLLTGGDPLEQARVSARRVAVMDFISAALFRERARSEM